MKRPAYARELIELRRAGTHPPVDIIVGRYWAPRPGRPVRLALASEDAGGALDLSCVAGLDITVVDRTNTSDWSLACRVAAAAADYARTAWVLMADGETQCIASMAWGSRQWDRTARCFAWPAWWSDARGSAYRKRNEDAARRVGERLMAHEGG